MVAARVSMHPLQAVLARERLEWSLTPQRQALIFAVPILFSAIMILMARHFTVFRWVTAENSVIEMVQLGLLVAASLLLVAIARRHLRERRRLAGLLALALALGSFFVAGEEIAWGQQLLKWPTPESLAEINAQQETTVHNIYSLHNAFINAVMVGGLCAALAPVARWTIWRNHELSPIGGLLAPPLCLIPCFFIPFAYRFVRLTIVPEQYLPHLIFQITKFSEVTETCLYFGVFVFAWLHYRLLARPAGRTSAAHNQRTAAAPDVA